MKEIRAYIRRHEVAPVFVSEVVEAVRIRDRARGEPALLEERRQGQTGPDART